MSDLKLFAGAEIRRLRRGLGLTQAAMADALGLSTSYLNLLERDQRPVSARVLLSLAETYDLDLRGFAAHTDQQLLVRLTEAFADPALSAFDVDPADVRELADRQPRLAEAFARLHAAYRETVSHTAGVMERYSDSGVQAGGAEATPVEDVRDALHERDNYFPELETAAEAFVATVDLRDGAKFAALAARLRELHGVETRILDYHTLKGVLRRYDRHSRRLLLSEMLEPSSRLFQTAVQIALFEAGELLDQLTQDSNLASPEARRLYRVALANYFAGAVIMPYDSFQAAAAKERYDLDVLARRFSASFEQVCHRLTTLRRPSQRGAPFFMVRVDQAGNVSKRFGGRVFPFARSGGACPRWNLFDAFRTPGQVNAQFVELPDGGRILSIARTVRRPVAAPGERAQLMAVALGCEARHAGAVVYADGLDLTGDDATPIGVNCRLCERVNCSQRAHPPLRRQLLVDENHRGLAPFSFRVS